MSKKDYVLIAAVIKSADADDLSVQGFARRLSFALQNENPRFNQATFLKACGQ